MLERLESIKELGLKKIKETETLDQLQDRKEGGTDGRTEEPGLSGTGNEKNRWNESE